MERRVFEQCVCVILRIASVGHGCDSSIISVLCGIQCGVCRVLGEVHAIVESTKERAYVTDSQLLVVSLITGTYYNCADDLVARFIGFEAHIWGSNHNKNVVFAESFGIIEEANECAYVTDSQIL